MLYRQQTITSVLREVDDEVAARLSQPPIEPERELIPTLSELLDYPTTPYLAMRGTTGIRTASRSSRRGAERRTGE